MKIRITRVLPTSAHFGNFEYDLVGCVGEVERISKVVVYDSESEYYMKEVDFVSISNCKYTNHSNELADGDSTNILGAEFEVIEE